MPNFHNFTQLAFHNWKSTNYLVELPQLPAKYLPITAATGDGRARHRVTVHKPPDRAPVSFLPSQSAKATVVVTVHGWRRGAEWWRCQRGAGWTQPSVSPSERSQELTDKQWRRLTEALARCFPQWHHTMTELSLKDVGLSVYQATTNYTGTTMRALLDGCSIEIISCIIWSKLGHWY